MFDVIPPAPGDGADGSAEGSGSTPLDIELIRPEPGVAVLAVGGEVDTLTAPRLDVAVAELVDGDDALLVVDLTDVTFLASSGLALLIRAAHKAGSDGRRIRLVAPGRPVLRPLQITGTDELFELHTDRATAVLTGRD